MLNQYPFLKLLLLFTFQEKNLGKIIRKYFSQLKKIVKIKIACLVPYVKEAKNDFY